MDIDNGSDFNQEIPQLFGELLVKSYRCHASEWCSDDSWVSACWLCERVGIRRRLLQKLVKDQKIMMHNG